MSAKEMIKRYEGLRLKPYICPAGRLTIGYGHNIQDNGITKAEADFILANDLVNTRRDLLAVFGDQVGTWSEARQDALTDMMFNMGLPVFLGFKNMIAAIKAEDWEEAARQALDSRWREQVGRRAVEDAGKIKGKG